MRFPSKAEIEKQREEQEFTLIPHQDYILEIVNLEESEQPKYKGKGNEPIVNVEFEVVSTRDGEIAYDDEGKEATHRKAWFYGKPESMSFQLDGTPAKTRALVAYATGQDINEEIELGSWKSLIGKKITAEIVQTKNQKGKSVNKITRFVPPKVGQELGSVKPPKTEEIPDEKDEIDPKDIPY